MYNEIMETKNLDVVYIVGFDEDNEQLRYSLRSLAKNIPHRNVWIYGGRLNWYSEKIQLGDREQRGGYKWQKASFSLRPICQNGQLSDDFVLMNDDFFILKPIEKLDYFYHTTLADTIAERRDDINAPNSYKHIIADAKRWLDDRQLPDKDYELHLPMIFNKKKLLELLQEQGAWVGATRSRYANKYAVGGEERQDVKIFKAEASLKPDADFVSTTPHSFAGRLGREIRDHFPNACKYEKPRL